MNKMQLTLILFAGLLVCGCMSNEAVRNDYFKDNTTKPCAWPEWGSYSDKGETVFSNLPDDLKLRDPKKLPLLEPSQTPCISHFIEKHPMKKVYQDDFLLGVAEFDDLGQPYNRSMMDRVIKMVEEQVDKGPVSLVIFVHGWRHNAAVWDDNVKTFRRILEKNVEHEHEIHPNQPRKVVGVYIGYRGKSLTGGGIPVLGDSWEALSIQDRRFAAERVAIRSVREFLSALKAIELQANNPMNDRCGQHPRVASGEAGAMRSTAKPVPGQREQQEQCVHMLIIAHSLGAQIVFDAISGFYLDQLAIAERARDDHRRCDTNEYCRIRIDPYGNLVVFINPAFEGARFLPLYSASRGKLFQPEQKPVLISITADNDWVTGLAFHVFRSIGTFFQGEIDPIEGQSNVTAVGHFDCYRTHALWLAESWNKLSDEKSREVHELNCDLTGVAGSVEQSPTPAGPSHFLEHYRKGGDQWQFGSKSTTVLLERIPQSQLNTPFWFITSYSPEILDEHSRFEDKPLTDFLTELYFDVSGDEYSSQKE